MEFIAFLERNVTSLVTNACTILERAHCERYRDIGPEGCRQRLQDLMDITLLCLKKRDLLPIINFMEAKADERFTQGFQIREVQIAINSLEESLWSTILTELSAEKQAEAFGFVSTVLGAGKDALARKYVSLASNRQVPAMNLLELFKGTEGIYTVDNE